MPGIHQPTPEVIEVPTKTVRVARPSSPVMASPPPSPKGRGVTFNDSPVSSELRYISNTEGWALHYFEEHARKCPDCCDPYERHLKHEQLCDKGHKLAQDVARMLYATKDGRIYSTNYSSRGRNQSEDDETYRLVRVEVPKGYSECHGLLRAIERSVRHRRRTPFVSLDRTYPISPRVVQAQPNSSKDKERSRSRRKHRGEEASHKSYRVRSTSPAVLTVEVSPSRSHDRKHRSSKRYSKQENAPGIEIVPWPAESSSATDTDDESTREREAHERAYEMRSQQQQRSRRDSFITPTIVTPPMSQQQPVVDVNKHHRGSLYVADEKERKKESRRYYNVELREPKFAKESNGPVLAEPRRRKTVYYS